MKNKKLLVVFVVFAAVLFGVSRLLIGLGSTYDILAAFKQGFLPYLISFCITIFTVIPLGEWWMDKK